MNWFLACIQSRPTTGLSLTGIQQASLRYNLSSLPMHLTNGRMEPTFETFLGAQTQHSRLFSVTVSGLLALSYLCCTISSKTPFFQQQKTT